MQALINTCTAAAALSVAVKNLRGSVETSNTLAFEKPNGAATALCLHPRQMSLPPLSRRRQSANSMGLLSGVDDVYSSFWCC